MIRNITQAHSIVPVVTAYDVDSTVEVAKALSDGGIKIIEITLRTDCSFDAIKAVKDAGVDICLGVGTIASSEDIHKLNDIGVDFGVSPGLTEKVLQTAVDTEFALLPGVTSPSEIMLGMQYGFDTFKLFPASALNPIPLLKGFYGPFPDIRFCPTGGVSLSNMNDFLSLPNVVCVGGTWMLNKETILNGEFDKVRDAAAEAMAAVK